MTDETSAAMFDQGLDWLASHRQLYLSTRGAKGHLMDLTFSGGKPFSTHLMLQHFGRKSGKSYVSVLLYGHIGGEFVIIGSKGGADHHPYWYQNLVAREEARFQIATTACRGTWRQAQGQEREEIWKLMVRYYPTFAQYQASTQRQIPVVLLRPIEEIPVFTEADAG
ncbi:MAG: nitroreductase/quinone reductase family protein [Gammaproteobacteria bacterium]